MALIIVMRMFKSFLNINSKQIKKIAIVSMIIFPTKGKEENDEILIQKILKCKIFWWQLHVIKIVLLHIII